MDTKLRELERKAASGDPEAKERFIREKMRAFGSSPIMLQFGCGQGVPTSGSRWLRSAGAVPSWGEPVLASDSILRGITISVDEADEISYYRVDVGTQGINQNPEQSRGSLILEAWETAAGCRDLYVEITALTPIGVKVSRVGAEAVGDRDDFSRGRRSTFSAISVTLEIWI
jgi:hypothetical protein